MSQLPAPRESPPAPVAAPGAAEPVSRAAQRVRRPQSQVVDGLAYAGAACFGLAGWVLGGFFTLTALASLGMPSLP